MDRMDMKQFLRGMGLKPEWDIYFDEELHLFAERLDNEYELHLFMEKQDDQKLIDFINWHIKQTTPVFGEWNYTIYKKIECEQN